MAYVIKVEQVLSETFIDDVVTTAVEGGINYWATEIHRVDDVISFAVDDTPGDGRKTVTHRMVAEAIQNILSEDMAGSYLTEQVREAVLTHDAGHIDAEGADVIVQVAALGEVVYG